MQIPIVESPTKMVMEKDKKDEKQAEIAAATASHTAQPMWGDDGFSFFDLLDVINPLQHIPVLSTAYRAVTGDEISSGARLAGGTIYGGFVGAIFAAVNNFSVEDTGKDIPENIAAALFGPGEPIPGEPSDTMLADVRASGDVLSNVRASGGDTVQALAPLPQIVAAPLAPIPNLPAAQEAAPHTLARTTVEPSPFPGLSWLAREQQDGESLSNARESGQSMALTPGNIFDLPPSLPPHRLTHASEAARTYQAQDAALKAQEHLADIEG